MNRKLVAWAVVLVLAFGAFTHPATAGKWAHEGWSGIHSLVTNVSSFAHSAKG